ncbi:DUF6263 family protein [Tuwongella immobilis]|uniref:DUF4412 domain-containing protein n=1 Tax=Tuwongella immobilis TaxID=692036 RepID=A0A6C2YN41_9BACT|nr:DUF6263 family protein [Tuwongella immobilis]VIP03028.1 Uncharacterized protein OS=Singulisphaera acidiphila (strain ATCC BAA-1392 / DSM 18658 / VKM B-2454 / MOB10) GN=Sinac_1320 PE=4 SV=1 [Tuwongella immobilis]VTS03172.1 Uncharacterized protein OS=Singulisphaera acidiphila (strain ATCC BAA-1392 / DSM 18658 / VKM B-2454 / MOB10) GN=Sinac_1320 PE=4 SV=1 [Tuwongella immobilis]
MLRRSIVLVAGLFLMSGVSALAQDTTAGLAWKFEKDKAFYQKVSTKTSQSMTIMGTPTSQTQEQTFYFKWTPVKEEGGKWTIKQTIEGVSMKIDIAGNPISYDSTAPSNSGNTALAEFFKSIIGAEFTLTLDKSFKVEKVEGRDEFVKKLVQTNAQMEPLLKQLLSDDAIKQMADPSFGLIPPEPKKVGENWKNVSKLDLGPIGSYENVFTYTYKGKDAANKDFDRVEVAVALSYKAPTTGGDALPFKIKSADLKSNQDKAPGVILFNTKTGRLESSKFEIFLGGKLEVEIGGMTTPVELKQEQVTDVTTSETSFIKK